jgi:hypothetical protein
MSGASFDVPQGFSLLQVSHFWPLGQGGPDTLVNVGLMTPNIHPVYENGLVCIRPDYSLRFAPDIPPGFMAEFRGRDRLIVSGDTRLDPAEASLIIARKSSCGVSAAWVSQCRTRARSGAGRRTLSFVPPAADERTGTVEDRIDTAFVQIGLGVVGVGGELVEERLAPGMVGRCQIEGAGLGQCLAQFLDGQQYPEAGLDAGDRCRIGTFFSGKRSAGALAGAQAVKIDAAFIAKIFAAVMNAATMPGVKIEAGVAGALVMAKAIGAVEAQRDAAKAQAVLAIGLKNFSHVVPAQLTGSPLALASVRIRSLLA